MHTTIQLQRECIQHIYIGSPPLEASSNLLSNLFKKKFTDQQLCYVLSITISRLYEFQPVQVHKYKLLHTILIINLSRYLSQSFKRSALQSS